MSQEHEIDAASVRRGVTQTIAELHVTGGVRAGQEADRLWSWYPAIEGGQLKQLEPRSIRQISELAKAVGLELFGGDQQSGLEGPLISRFWTPLDGPHSGSQPADLWRSIATNASDAGDSAYALFARHISYSLTAAGIRLRDASDGYHLQLLAAVENGTSPGDRFANAPMQDLQLAFHSVLSELASARDYLAASLALTMGAPSKIDAMNRFKEWISAASRAHLAAEPVANAMLIAYEPTSTDSWLHHLTEYRNRFLHRQPLGSGAASQMLVFTAVEKEGLLFPRITMPLDPSDPFAPNQDALSRFLELYRAMTRLVQLAAAHAPYPATMTTFVVK